MVAWCVIFDPSEPCYFCFLFSLLLSTSFAMQVRTHLKLSLVVSILLGGEGLHDDTVVQLAMEMMNVDVANDQAKS